LLLVVDLRPAGMPDRLRRPFDERLPEELWTLDLLQKSSEELQVQVIEAR
jgi:hypothetical protein